MLLRIYFSSNAVSGNHREHLPYTPQLVVSPNTYITDRINWVKIDLQYQAQGGEEYITIGNFNDTNYIDTTFVPGGGSQVWMQASYYYLDDIWLSHCDSLPESLVTGLNEPFLRQRFKVYPNPFVSEITLESKSKENLVFALYNSLGQEVEVQIQQFEGRYQIVTDDIPIGLYWLQINDGLRSKTVKLIKH
ncbi:MAG: T9SS type A sorting domain-containing protein [Vicingaceae bacterium]